MKGFVLSMDAIVASSILFLIIVALASFSFTVSTNELEVKRVYTVAKDVNNVLFEVRMFDLAEFQLARDILVLGPLEREDANMSFIDVVGFLYTTGNTSLAMNLTELVLDSLLEDTTYGYELIFENTSLHKRDKPQKRFLAQTHSVVSGFGAGNNPEGYVASAVARKVKANTSRIITVNPQGSALRGNYSGIITKKFFLNFSDITVNNATLVGSVQYRRDAPAPVYTLNGNAVGLSGIENLIKSFNGSIFMILATKSDVTDYIVDGWNELIVNISGGDALDGHVHTGFRIDMQVQEDVDVDASESEDSTYYFSNMLSKGSAGASSGAWAVMPFFIPQGANVTSVYLHLNARNVNNVSEENIPDEVPNKANIQIYLNNETISLYNPASFDEDEEVNVSLYYEMADSVVGGTNVLYVYLNSYQVHFWGRADTVLYSEPENDSSGSSSLRVQFEKPSGEIKFGQFPISISRELGGSSENPKAFNQSFGREVFRTFLHLNQLDDSNTTVKVTRPGFSQQVFQSPRINATPSTIFIDPVHLSTSENNTINISDSCENGCSILKKGRYEWYIWLPSHVGYGHVFPNSSAAIQDALDRLNSSVQPFGELEDINAVNQSVPEVKAMWGPARLELRVWL